MISWKYFCGNVGSKNEYSRYRYIEMKETHVRLICIHHSSILLWCLQTALYWALSCLSTHRNTLHWRSLLSLFDNSVELHLPRSRQVWREFYCWVMPCCFVFCFRSLLFFPSHTFRSKVSLNSSIADLMRRTSTLHTLTIDSINKGEGGGASWHIESMPTYSTREIEKYM